jgi:hypothetical protein
MLAYIFASIIYKNRKICMLIPAPKNRFEYAANRVNGLSIRLSQIGISIHGISNRHLLQI